MWRTGQGIIALVVVFMTTAFVVVLLAFFWVSAIKPLPYMIGAPHVQDQVSSREFISRTEVAPRPSEPTKSSNTEPAGRRENVLP